MSEENENQTESDEVTDEVTDIVDEPAAEAEPVADSEPAAEPEPEPAAEAPEASATVAEEAAEPAEESGEAAEEAPAKEVAAEETAAAAPEPAVASSGPKPKKKRLPRSARPQRTKRKREQTAGRKPITRLEKPEHVRGRRQERQGTVVSAGADKTIVVRVDVVKAHPTYKKVIKRSTRLHAHDERNEAKLGDIVRIVETRPLSKLKRWRLHEIVEAAK